MALGISTLLAMVPVPLAAAHQSGALMLLSSFLYLLQTLGPQRRVKAGADAVAAASKALFPLPFLALPASPSAARASGASRAELNN